MVDRIIIKTSVLVRLRRRFKGLELVYSESIGVVGADLLVYSNKIVEECVESGFP